MPRADYSRWDGSQVGFDLDADAVLAEVTDDLLYHGDLNAALRRMLQSGFRDRDGNKVQGMRELLERLRRKRREELERHDLGGVYDEVADALREVVETERQGLDDLEAEARASGDSRRQEITEEVTSEKRLRLDLLRQQLTQSYFNNMAGAMSNPDPEAMARMKDMLSELNHMLEQRERGEEPDFEGFMDRYGDFFPENPQTLDELLEAMAARMAAMQAMLNSMTPEQRAQLQGLAEQLLEDMDLRWQVDQLSSHLQQAFPQAGWDRRYQFSGQDPLGFAEAAQL